MEGFTLIDGIVAIVIVISAILAYSRGLVREALAIAGWIVAAIVAFIFAPSVEPLMREIPVIGEFLVDSCELGILTAFAAVFAGALIVVSIITPLFSSAVQRSALGGVDQGLGFLFGVLRGALLVAIALWVYDAAIVGDPIPMVEDSRTAQIFAAVTQNLSDQLTADTFAGVTARYEELVSACQAPPSDA